MRKVEEQNPNDLALCFGKRVKQYESSRPSYPKAAIRDLQRQCRLSSESIIVDVGAGTGKLTELLLTNIGAKVIAVDPDQEMLTTCDAKLKSRFPEKYHSFIASAEAIPLADKSVDCITIATALHWFKPQAVCEFTRILRANGHIVVFNNFRHPEAEQRSPLAHEYEQMLYTHGDVEEYKRALQKLQLTYVESFFIDYGMTLSKHYDNPQRITEKQLWQRVKSAAWFRAKTNLPQDNEQRKAFKSYVGTLFKRSNPDAANTSEFMYQTRMDVLLPDLRR